MSILSVPLRYIPANKAEPENGRFIQSDAFALVQISQHIDWTRSGFTKGDKRAMIDIRNQAHDCNDADIHELRLTPRQANMLLALCQDPMAHLKDEVTSQQGTKVKVREEFLNTDVITSTLLSLELALETALGLPHSDDEEDEDTASDVPEVGGE
tara:strand:- start:2308 stop:2772 length:465 start_codon:yes stop_codon:yes gene_type:complete